VYNSIILVVVLTQIEIESRTQINKYILFDVISTYKTTVLYYNIIFTILLCFTRILQPIPVQHSIGFAILLFRSICIHTYFENNNINNNCYLFVHGIGFLYHASNGVFGTFHARRLYYKKKKKIIQVIIFYNILLYYITQTMLIECYLRTRIKHTDESL